MTIPTEQYTDTHHQRVDFFKTEAMGRVRRYVIDLPRLALDDELDCAKMFMQSSACCVSGAGLLAEGHCASNGGIGVRAHAGAVSRSSRGGVRGAVSSYGRGQYRARDPLRRRGGVLRRTTSRFTENHELDMEEPLRQVIHRRPPDAADQTRHERDAIWTKRNGRGGLRGQTPSPCSGRSCRTTKNEVHCTFGARDSRDRYASVSRRCHRSAALYHKGASRHGSRTEVSSISRQAGKPPQPRRHRARASRRLPELPLVHALASRLRHLRSVPRAAGRGGEDARPSHRAVIAARATGFKAAT